MPLPFIPDQPELEEIKLRITDEQVTIDRWTSYGFASDFLTPSDGWHFVIGASKLDPKQRKALKNGARVSLLVNNTIICDGRIDKVIITGDKSSGTIFNVSGRDRLGMPVDSTANPKLQFKEGSTLADVLKKIFEPYGWVADDHFVIDAHANESANHPDRGVKRSKSKKHFGQPLKNFKTHQLKPHSHEGTFAFASRVSQRFGLWIWATSDGDQLVVGKPNFEQEPSYQLVRSFDGVGNIESGGATYDGTDQPSIIIADGFSGGGEFGEGRIKVFCVNPFYGVDEQGFVLDEVTAIIAQFPDAEQVIMTTQPLSRRVALTPPRPMFLHDDESKDKDQLVNYVRREMSQLMRKSLTCEYTVTGHGQITDDQFVPWAMDTVVDVQDDLAEVHERMYVLGVEYEKSRTGGTNTKLKLIRLNSIQFGDPVTPAGSGSGTGNGNGKTTEVDVNKIQKHHETETR